MNVRPYLLSFLLLLPFRLLFAQSPDNLIPRELLFREKDKARVTLSMDGENVFYQKRANGSDSTLWYVPVKSPHVEKQQRFAGQLVDWTPAYDDGLVAVVRQDTSLVVFSAPLTSPLLRKLDLPAFRKIEFLHLSSRFPNKILVNFIAEDPDETGIYLVDLLNGNMKRMGVMGDFTQLFFDENFGMVAAMRPNEQGGNTILRRHEGKWLEVFDYPFSPEIFIGGLSRIISVSKDGKTIYATDNTGKDKTSFVSVDVASGTVTEILGDPDADILPFAASVDPAGKPTSVVALWGDTRRHISDESIRPDFEFLDKELGSTVSFAGASRNDSTWLIRKLNGGPVTYYHYDRPAKKLTELFNDYTHLDGYELATRRAYTVPTRDGFQLPVHIYVPPGMSKPDGSPKAPLPTVIYIHGGPWAGVTHWNSWFHNRNFQLLANRGYVVINMEFRGTTGLGKKVTDAGDLQWGAAMHYDIVDVTTWAIRSGISNRKKVGIWGWSYGGYATNFALGAAPDLYACGISMYGISDLEAFGKLPFAGNETWRTRVGDVNTEAGAALLKQHSPVTYVKDIISPLLLTTGSLDERVPQSQSDNFADALQKAGKEVVYFYYPEEVHDYRQAESWISFWAIAEHFLHENLGGRKAARETDIELGNLEIMYGADYIEKID